MVLTSGKQPGSPPDGPQTGADRWFFGHPRGLVTLFSVEMWERFSWYALQALLVLYLSDTAAGGGLGMERGTAASLVSAYGTLVYLLSVVGGWFADRLIGGRRSVLVGGVAIACGHYAMAVPTAWSTWAGLALIILGTGFLKPNAANVVGKLYRRDDVRRDAGFSLYYMGINIGALLGQIVGGWLGQGWGYHWGFSCAAAGMTLGLVQYVLGRRHLPDSADRPDAPLPPGRGARAARRAGAVVLALAVAGCVAGLTGTLTLEAGIDLITGVSVAVPVVYFVVMFASPRTERGEKSALAAYVPLFVAAAAFYTIFNQFSSVLTLFAAERTDAGLFGWHFPSSWFFAVNPGAGLLLAPLLASLWTRMGPRQPATSLKFGASLFFVGASFLLIPVAVALTQGDRVAAPWLVLVYLTQTVAELLLAPVGMAVTTRLAPRAFHGQTLAVWFCAPAMGAGIGAQLVRYYGKVSDLVYFGATGAAAILLGILIAAMTPWIRRRAGTLA
ncbi:peptide MFS transporter [Streptomyces rimosus]|uniref:peptide MFS transporter n=1 Tax=Streptomyces rimosus TaxID=1927 RepID=UPI0004C588A7|nr:oligopeptide:H+ symporter [Streptomyces rimosus]